MTKSEKLAHCAGCKNNFYNGNNPYGVEECWGLAEATLTTRKKVHINQVQPWDQKPEKYLSCYHQDGYVFIGPSEPY